MPIPIMNTINKITHLDVLDFFHHCKWICFVLVVTFFIPKLLFQDKEGGYAGGPGQVGLS